MLSRLCSRGALRSLERLRALCAWDLATCATPEAPATQSASAPRPVWAPQHRLALHGTAAARSEADETAQAKEREVGQAVDLLIEEAKRAMIAGEHQMCATAGRAHPGTRTRTGSSEPHLHRAEKLLDDGTREVASELGTDTQPYVQLQLAFATLLSLSGNFERTRQAREG